jgi:hypothetical protein
MGSKGQGKDDRRSARKALSSSLPLLRERLTGERVMVEKTTAAGIGSGYRPRFRAAFSMYKPRRLILSTQDEAAISAFFDLRLNASLCLLTAPRNRETYHDSSHRRHAVERS